MVYERLFEPISLGRVEVKNRIALAPMGVGLAPADEILHARNIRYVEERAKGGVGLVISQFIFASKLGWYPLPGIYDDRFIAGHRKYVDACHKHGAKVFLQIATFGGKGGPEAPSGIDSPMFFVRPRELTKEEIEKLIDDFIQSARRGAEAGYDGVELHGSHGYMMEQFMSPHTNKRSDEYGGSFENRMRVPVTIVRGIHKKLGDDFPVGFKMSAWEEVQGGIDFPLAQDIARRMTKENLVYVHVATMASTIFALSDYPSVPPMYSPRNTLMPLADNIRQAVPSIPLIATGSIVNPADAEEFISAGRADMVAVGRALIADPNWAQRAREGKRYRPCIRCNWCHDELFSGREVRCSVNPHILHEAREPLPPAGAKKKVLVVGGGPGGIMAALTAARRGHSVTLYEQERELGGMLVPGTKPAFKKDVSDFLAYLRAEIAESTVTVRTGVSVTPALVEKEAPDAMVIAMGGRSVIPAIQGISKKHVFDAIDVLKNVGLVKGSKVAVIGGGDVGCEVAAHLAQNGKNVTIIEMLMELMEDEIINVKIVLEKIMKNLDIRVLLGSKVEAITDETVIVMGRSGVREVEAQAVVLAMGLKEQDGEMKLLEAKCDDVYVVGDCVKQGRIRDAVRDGEMAGRLI